VLQEVTRSGHVAATLQVGRRDRRSGRAEDHIEESATNEEKEDEPDPLDGIVVAFEVSPKTTPTYDSIPSLAFFWVRLIHSQLVVPFLVPPSARRSVLAVELKHDHPGDEYTGLRGGKEVDQGRGNDNK